jgi:predicted DNA-binding transcriptional regulator AlpA
MATPNTLEELLTEHDVSRLLKVSVATIRRRRLLRQPPEWLKIGASVRYTRASIERLIQDSQQASRSGEHVA